MTSFLIENCHEDKPVAAGWNYAQVTKLKILSLIPWKILRVSQKCSLVNWFINILRIRQSVSYRKICVANENKKKTELRNTYRDMYIQKKRKLSPDEIDYT